MGDREVCAHARRALLGGEQSGHIIFRDRLNTGDGILTALELFSVVRRAGKPLAELAAPVELYPQLLINIPLRPGLEWQNSSPLGRALEEIKALVEPEGRIVVRPSGTEPLLRVMIETPHQDILNEASQRIQTADNFPGLTCTLLSPAG